jgi:hypothetical protein
MKITYSSNNSGGGWWLKDEDWYKLEEAGWKIKWHKDQKGKWFKADAEGRWLGALAGEASKNFKTVREAMEEFERITGQDVTDEGCNCCGAPHSFNWTKDGWQYASGDDCSQYLYGDEGNLSKRELLERIK